jgi:hypothetical protein
MSSSSPAPSTWSRGKIGILLLVLCFIPAGLNAIAPDFWAGLPSQVRWASYALSGLCIAAIVWLIMAADYSNPSPARDDTA